MTDVQVLLQSHLDDRILERESVKVHKLSSENHRFVVYKSSIGNSFELEYLTDAGCEDCTRSLLLRDAMVSKSASLTRVDGYHEVNNKKIKSFCISLDLGYSYHIYMLYNVFSHILKGQAEMINGIKSLLIKEFECNPILLDLHSRTGKIELDLPKEIPIRDRTIKYMDSLFQIDKAHDAGWPYRCVLKPLMNATTIFPLSKKISRIEIRKNMDDSYIFWGTLNRAYLLEHIEFIKTLLPKASSDDEETLFTIRSNGDIEFKNYSGGIVELVIFLKMMHKIEPFPKRLINFLNDKFELELVLQAPPTTLKERIIAHMLENVKLRENFIETIKIVYE